MQAQTARFYFILWQDFGQEIDGEGNWRELFKKFRFLNRTLTQKDNTGKHG